MGILTVAVYFILIVTYIFTFIELSRLANNLSQLKLFPRLSKSALYVASITWASWAVAIILSSLQFFGLLSKTTLFINLAFFFASISFISISFLGFLILINQVQVSNWKSLPVLILGGLFLGVSIGLILISMTSPLVYDVHITQARYLYSPAYSLWRKFFFLTTVFGVMSYFIFLFKVKSRYQREKIKLLLISYLGTIIWGTFWNVLIPSVINTSKFSIFGPLAGLVYLYFIANVWGVDYLNLTLKIKRVLQKSSIRILLKLLVTSIVFFLIVHVNIAPSLQILILYILLLSIQVIFTVFYDRLKIKSISSLKLSDIFFQLIQSTKDIDDLIEKIPGLIKQIIEQKTGIRVKIQVKPSSSEIKPSNVPLGSALRWYEHQDGITYSLRLRPRILHTKSYEILLTVEDKFMDVYIILETIMPYLEIAFLAAELMTISTNLNKELEKRVEERTAQLKQANLQLKRSRERLNRMVEELKKADEQKTIFISVASHQLRTPVSILKNYINMFELSVKDRLEPDQLELLQRIKDAINQLAGIVTDILETSRIERGKFSVHLERIRPADIALKLYKQFKPIAIRKNIRLDIHIPEHVKNMVIYADPTKLQEAYSNLIANAIQYTESGGSVDIYMYTPNPKWLVFAVKDTGIGIPEDKQHLLFKKFVRLENAKKMRPDGTGIGLYLVKNVAISHNGRVWFKSKVGQGSVFYLAIPTDLKPPEQQ